MREIEICIDSAPDIASPYPDNRVSSKKYNKWNFLPITLFMQLKNAINMFFIINGIL